MVSESSQATFVELTPNLRIFAPQSYQSIRGGGTFPIVHVEAMAMARAFPVVWRMEEGRPKLRVLRSFLKSPLVHNPERRLSHASELPLWARAYPILMQKQDADAEPSIYVSTEFADKPTDAGAPLHLPDGRLSVGTEQRLRALAIYAQHEEATDAVSADLHLADCLVEWRLPFASALKEHLTDAPLLVLRGNLSSSILRRLVSRRGQAIFHLIGAHRLSLFRSALLARTAEQDLKIDQAVA